MVTCGTYNLDAAGNWVSDGGGTPAVSFTHGCGVQDTQDRTTNTWNQVASLTNSGVPITPIQYDAKGNLTAYGNLSFTFDAFNRMISASGTGPDGQPVSASYAYDALGRRIQKLVNDAETNFVYDGQQVVEERDEANALLRQYVWGQYVDELVQQREYERPPFGGPYGDLYPLSDMLHRSWALTHDRECGTGSSGGPGGAGGASSSSGPTTPFVEVYDTDAYGRTRVYNAPGPDGQWFTDDDQRTFVPLCRYLYTGREYDPETGLYYYRARYYHPDLGRFLSRDPMLFDGGDANLYRYCFGNPLVNTDPSGEIVGLVLLGLAALAVTGVIAYESVRGDPVAMPSFGEQMIPIYGSSKAAIHDFQSGHWGWGLFNTAMAISDIFLVKSAFTAVGKLGINLLGRETAVAAGRTLAASAGGTAAKLSGRRLFVHLTEEQFAKVMEGGRLGMGFRESEWVFEEGRIWATKYAPAELQGVRGALRKTLIGKKFWWKPSRAVEITGEAAEAFSRPFGPRFSLNPVGWIKGFTSQYQFRGTLAYLGGDVIETLAGATRYTRGQMALYRAGELIRLGVYTRLPAAGLEQYGEAIGGERNLIKIAQHFVHDWGGD